MTLPNTLTLAQLRDMEPQDVLNLPVDQIAMLLEAVEDMKANAKALDAKLHAALVAKYGETANRRRKANGQDTGRVRILTDEGDEVACDLPKVVTWDQGKLAALYVKIKEDWKGDPAEYIKVKYEVAESKFNAWPSELSRHFLPARTVKAGKPSFEIILKEGDE
jgi:hypothetical protein